VLEIEPGNVHALSNLARLLYFTGRQEAAFSVANQMKESKAEAADLWAKKAEALSFLDDDDGVLSLYEQAKRAGDLHFPQASALFYHLVAVAMFHKGREREARRLWKEALKTDPSYNLANENLKDIDRPVGERNAPWAFPLGSWVPDTCVRELARLLAGATRRKSEQAVEAATQRFLEKHPELIFIAPSLLARGDARGREFIINLAGMSENQELFAALKEFALGQHGADQLRMKAAQLVSEKGMLPSGSVRFWIQGEWKDILLLSFEITPEPEGHFQSPEAETLAEQAYEALRSRDGEEAQQLLERAIAIEPDMPSLHNNLALALELRGENEKAHAMVQEIHARFPDYFFGIVSVARLAIQDGDLETAHSLLNELMQRKRLHTTEFAALCMAQIETWLAEKNREAAKTWFEMWEKADPENSGLEAYRAGVGKPWLPPGMFGS
jgi:tetratricopeptide (TPR) repeat protein